jgi:hypothetical protein
MRPIYIYLISSIGIAACWMNSTPIAHGQLSQVLSDYKYDRPIQYAPSDPWTRSKLFNRQTKHFGFGYNCDGEECKRNSPHICWKNTPQNDRPCKTGWCQRLNQTVAEVKQRIADGSCVDCNQVTPSQHCQQGCNCEHRADHPEHLSSNGPSISNDNIAQDAAEDFDVEATQSAITKQKPAIAPLTRSAGLESLDIRTR